MCENYYFCKCYPEYNLFTLERLIPIEIDAGLCEAPGIFRFYSFRQPALT